MTFIALDDEPLALVLIEKLAREIPILACLGTFTDAAAAADFLRNNTVDLLLTDINMPDVSGLQFVRELPDERPMVIFCTAHKEHAHEGFDLDVVDYWVKPISQERFKKGIQKAADLYALRQKENTPQVEAALADHFFVYSDYLQVKITIKDILYIESMGDYVKIHLAIQKKPVMTLERLKNLATRLEAHGFQRIHRSYLVNMEKVEAKQRAQLRVGEVWLPVGEIYRISLGDT
jgi:two-component system, LytTR family, response regulator